MIIYVIFGASGDLAHKKTLPAIYNLWSGIKNHSCLKLIGFARSKYTTEEFRDRVKNDLSKRFHSSTRQSIDLFTSNIEYITGQYDQNSSYHFLKSKINLLVDKLEKSKFTVIFYFAIPPSIYTIVAKNLHTVFKEENYNLKLILEKPFGKDLASVKENNYAIRSLFKEKEIFRIDHYLGKEMVKAIMVLRFSNNIFSSIWNSDHLDFYTDNF